MIFIVRSFKIKGRPFRARGLPGLISESKMVTKWEPKSTENHKKNTHLENQPEHQAKSARKWSQNGFKMGAKIDKTSLENRTRYFNGFWVSQGDPGGDPGGKTPRHWRVWRRFSGPLLATIRDQISDYQRPDIRYQIPSD